MNLVSFKGFQEHFFSLLMPKAVLISEETDTQEHFVSPIKNLDSSFALQNLHVGHGS